MIRLAAATLALALAGCPRGPVDRPDRVDANDAIVFVTAEVPDAALWVDGVLVGPVGDLRRGFAVEPGKHRLELHHDAYFSHYQELDLAPAQRLRLTIELAPTLP